MILYVFYCLQHGDCFLSNGNIPHHNPCRTQNGCRCELIASVTQTGDLVSRVGGLARYFNQANDGYHVEYLQKLIDDNNDMYHISG